jgi:hypothetical protein
MLGWFAGQPDGSLADPDLLLLLLLPALILLTNNELDLVMITADIRLCLESILRHCMRVRW